jgi:hypothetical protein
MVSPSDEPSSFSFRFSEGAVHHIREKHINDRSEGRLWAEEFGSMADLVAVLTPEITRSLERPLYVEYDQHDERGHFLHKTRELVTRVGILVVLRLTEHNIGDVVTAFFPRETYLERRQRRWLAALRSRIDLYAVIATHGQAEIRVVPPAPEDVFPSRDPAGDRRNVRFVSEARWGFRSVVIHDELWCIWRCPGAWPIV